MIRTFFNFLALLFLLPVFLSGQDFRIYTIDVDQADATLIVTPNSKSLLIDCGSKGDGELIKAIMDSAGVTQIDHFVCTHYHADHYGCIEELVDDLGIHIDKAYDRRDTAHVPKSKKKEGSAYDVYQRLVGDRAEHLTRGESIDIDPLVSVTCYSSGGVVLGEQDPVTTGHDENDMSISLLIKYGSFWYFNGGDIEIYTERKLDTLNLIKNIDVYKASHHGAETSNSYNFMKDLSPAVIIISNGNNALYDHPRQITLDNFARLNPAPTVFQTNKFYKGGDGGNVEDSHIADLESDNSGDGTIRITVNSDPGTYDLTYGESEYTFSIKDRNEAIASLVISSLLPNPEGDDRLKEEVTICNKGNESCSLDGCVLKDRSGRIWALAGNSPLPPGDSITIVRNGMPMILTNSGDSITLLGTDDRVIDYFVYDQSSNGTRIYTHH